MRFVVASATAFLLALVLVVAGATPARADAAASVLPESCGVAQRAPVLESDHVDPAASATAATVPILMVHGWLGTATHDESRTGAFSQFVADATPASRSLIGMLQSIPGAAVYTFDYRSLAARWVTDPGIGDALAVSLHCLTAASGTRAIVVAHSMGGLATREALAQSVDGIAIASVVSDVVTFGTPNTGSALAASLSQTVSAIDLFAPGGALAGGRLGLSALLQLCGAAFTRDADLASGCSGVPTVDAFASEAGIALRSGSPEIAALPPWPSAVHVVALAGDVRIPLLDALAAALGLSSTGDPQTGERTVSLGDVVVGTASAEAGVDERHVVTCTGSLADGFEDSLCQHANLMRNPVLAGWATEAVAQAVANDRSSAPAMRAGRVGPARTGSAATGSAATGPAATGPTIGEEHSLEWGRTRSLTSITLRRLP